MKYNSFIRVLFCLLISALACYYLVGDNLKAQFWIIDDHEIMQFLGRDMKVSAKEIPTLISQSEVAKFGRYTRYRPVYYILKITESYMWGNRPYLWYATRLLIFIFFVTVCFYIVSDSFGFLHGFLFTGIMLSEHYWGDIFARLGPSESYGALGTGMYLLGFFFIYKNKIKKRAYSILSYIVLFLGLIIATGSRENFLILILPTIWLYWNLYKNKRLNTIKNVGFIMAGVFATLIVLSVVIGISQKGTDVYMNDVSPVSRLIALLYGIVNTWLFMRFPSKLLLPFIFLFEVVRSMKNARIDKGAKRLLQYIGLLSILYFSQIVFYNGQWPAGTRYDFPGKLIEPMLILLIIQYLLDFVKATKASQAKIKLFKVIFIICFGILYIDIIAIQSVRAASKTNVERTARFTKYIERVTNTLKKTPHAVVVLESYMPQDYELIGSVTKYLRVNKIENKFYLKYSSIKKTNTMNILEQKLSDELATISEKGILAQPNGWWNINIEPLHTLKNKPLCYYISFSGESKIPQCTWLGRIW